MVFRMAALTSREGDDSNLCCASLTVRSLFFLGTHNTIMEIPQFKNKNTQLQHLFGASISF